MSDTGGSATLRRYCGTLKIRVEDPALLPDLMTDLSRRVDAVVTRIGDDRDRSLLARVSFSGCRLRRAPPAVASVGARWRDRARRQPAIPAIPTLSRATSQKLPQSPLRTSEPSTSVYSRRRNIPVNGSGRIGYGRASEHFPVGRYAAMRGTVRYIRHAGAVRRSRGRSAFRSGTRFGCAARPRRRTSSSSTRPCRSRRSRRRSTRSPPSRSPISSAPSATRSSSSPGTYGSPPTRSIFQVGYYTQVAGLGAQPGDVVINGAIDVFNQCSGTAARATA